MTQSNKFEDLNNWFMSLGTGMTQSNKFRNWWRTLLFRIILAKQWVSFRWKNDRPHLVGSPSNRGCESSPLSQTVRSSKAGAKVRNDSTYGRCKGAAGHAIHERALGSLAVRGFLQLGAGGKRRIHCHAFEARAGKKATQNRPAASQSANAIRGGSIKGKAGERVQAKGGRL